MKLGLACLVSIGLMTVPAAAIEMTFPLTFTGAEERPGPGDPDGTGVGTITFDRNAGTISWNITYSDILGPTAMHIHTGAAGVGGGVFVGMGVATSGGAGTLISSVSTSVANIDAILSDPTGYYVNIHTPDFSPGAIRAQIPALFQICMCGENEIPGPGDPDGTAMGWIAFDTGSNEVQWDFTYANINPPTAMHIHTGATGVGGGVLVGMGVGTTGGPGTLNGITTTSVANITNILADPAGFYVNIHTADFSPGAVRGQIESAARQWDFNCDCSINAADLGSMLGSWGNPFTAAELGSLLGSWGPCP